MAGRQQFEVLKDIQPLAETSARVAFALSKGETFAATGKVGNGAEQVPMVATPVYAITKNNLEDKIFKTGFHSKDAVYTK